MDVKTKNKELIRKYHDGESDAFDRLIIENLGLVKSAVKRFIGRGTEPEDLVQIGTIGLIKAAKAFRPELGYEFSTYAFTMIIGEIRRFLRDDGLIKVSRSTKKMCAELLSKKEKYIAQHGLEPKISELSEMCGISVEEAVFCLGAMTPIASLSSTDSDDNSDFTLQDRIGVDYISEYEEKFALREALKLLSPEERTLIELRYVASLTQCEVAKRLNTTQVRISRTEKKILAKLREMLS